MSNFVFLFDLDGVISDTASIHARAWKTVFDKVLICNGICNSRFDEYQDYFRFIDGKSRLTGIQDYLNACAIELPLGEDNSVGLDSMKGIGNSKNSVFLELIKDGVSIFPDAVRFLEKLRKADVKFGLASSSKNARYVLEKAKLLDCFDSIMDGVVAEKLGIASKPSPEFYLHASSLLNCSPNDCIVIEDAISGVSSASHAGVGVVVGVSRVGDGEELLNHGADIVISSLDDERLLHLY